MGAAPPKILTTTLLRGMVVRVLGVISLPTFCYFELHPRSTGQRVHFEFENIKVFTASRVFIIN